MFEPTRRDEEPKKNASSSAAPTTNELLHSPSLFVASVVELLHHRNSDQAHACAEELSRHGSLTGAQFSVLIDTLPHPTYTAEVIWAYAQLSKWGVDRDFVQGVPAFLKLAHRSLTECSELDQGVAQRVSRVLDRLLECRIAFEELAERVQVVVGERERCLLQSIVARVDQERPGYWECAELLCALYPDVESLECLFSAVDRLGVGPHPKKALLGITRSVAAIGVADFGNVFKFVVRALGDSERPGGSAVRSAAAAGLSCLAGRHLDEMTRFIDSEIEALTLFASDVCVLADQDDDIELDPFQRETLATHLRRARSRDAYNRVDSSVGERLLTALGHISPRLSDIEEVGSVACERLKRGDPLSSDVIRAYAEGLSRIEGERGIVAFQPLSVKRFRALDAVPPRERTVEPRAHVAVGKTADDDFESLALDIAKQRRLDDVLALCREREDMLDTQRLSRRQPDSLSLFYSVKEAAQFARHHAVLAEKGPPALAAVLFPELLSVLARGYAARKRSVAHTIAEAGIRSLASLASLAAHDPKIRELAVARLSSTDWNFLDHLHKVNEGPYSAHYPELGLAGFAVRAVLDDDTTWQKDLVTWWGKVPDKARDATDPNALAFVGVVAERTRSGAVWDLLRRIPIVAEDAQTFSDIATGLLARSGDAVRHMCVDILSQNGGEIARALLVAQLMAPHCPDPEREHLIRAAKGHLDEMGILGVDAAATLGALSSDRSDALLLLEREPVLGMKENVYRISCALAAAKIVQNNERRAHG